MALINSENKKNMHQVLLELKNQTKGRNIIKYMTGTSVTEVSSECFFAEVEERSRFLKEKGLAGKHVGIAGRNDYQWLVHFCAVLWAEAAAVLLDRELNSEAFAELAGRTDLDAVLYDSYTEKMVFDAELPARVMRISMQEKQREAAGRECEPEKGQAEAVPGDLACILFTSGTTGQAKAVMLSQRALMASVCHCVIGRKFDALLTVMPFHHLSGFATMLNALCLGSTICLADDLKYLYRYLEVMKPDYVSVVPSMLQMLVRKLKKAGPNGSLLGWNLRMIHCGGAAFPPEVIEMLKERNITVLQGYGASEAGGIGFSWEMTAEHPDTIGKPPAGLEVKLEDGELFLRSESVMMGYYGDEKATSEVLCDGWYATGDLCRQDEEGYLYLTGRKKNLIILSNGENISPEEIETKLYACDAIREVMVGARQNLLIAAVFPNLPSDCTGREAEEIKGRIEEAIEQYNRNSPLYKQIKGIHFLDEPFVKTAVGKLIRQSVTGEEEYEKRGTEKENHLCDSGVNGNGYGDQR